MCKNPSLLLGKIIVMAIIIIFEILGFCYLVRFRVIFHNFKTFIKTSHFLPNEKIYCHCRQMWQWQIGLRVQKLGQNFTLKDKTDFKNCRGPKHVFIFLNGLCSIIEVWERALLNCPLRQHKQRMITSKA